MYNAGVAIRFKYGNVHFVADTPEEVEKTLTLLQKRDAETRMKRILGLLNEGQIDDANDMIREGTFTWTSDLFVRLIDRLGDTQIAVLGLLKEARHATDDELRACVHVSNNQALAGVLSGISKQAAALGISARDIFSFENLRNGGKRRNIYKIANKFYEIANRMNWPGPHQVPHQN